MWKDVIPSALELVLLTLKRGELDNSGYLFFNLVIGEPGFDPCAEYMAQSMLETLCPPTVPMFKKDKVLRPVPLMRADVYQALPGHTLHDKEEEADKKITADKLNGLKWNKRPDTRGHVIGADVADAYLPDTQCNDFVTINGKGSIEGSIASWARYRTANRQLVA